MGWRTIVVNTHSKLTYKNNHLIFKNAYEKQAFHLSEIDILVLETTDITVTTMLLKRLIDEKILVIFCDDKRLPKSVLQPYYGRHDSSLQLAKQLDWNQELKEMVWTEIIYQKMSNQATFLKETKDFEKSDRIHEFRDNLEINDPNNREGHAARIYFNSLFGNNFSRQQEIPINAALNYGYTLILSMFSREVVINGCMTQFGLKHANQFNDFNLASDLMEPFRIIIDQIVYSYRDESFKTIKKHLFSIFTTTFKYRNSEMYLTNIVSDYVRRTIKFLNQESERIPEFRL